MILGLFKDLYRLRFDHFFPKIIPVLAHYLWRNISYGLFSLCWLQVSNYDLVLLSVLTWKILLPKSTLPLSILNVVIISPLFLLTSVDIRFSSFSLSLYFFFLRLGIELLSIVSFWFFWDKATKLVPRFLGVVWPMYYIIFETFLYSYAQNFFWSHPAFCLLFRCSKSLLFNFHIRVYKYTKVLFAFSFSQEFIEHL